MGSAVKTALIGYGYWGPNLARNIARSERAVLATVCDNSEARLAEAGRLYPSATLVRDPSDVFADPDLDAVVIATPVTSHFELAMRALQAGKHVLVEKPMTATVPEAEKLVDEAERRGRLLMVDHTFVYTSAVRKIRSLIEDGSLGELYYLDSVRANLGLFQSDVSVVWDLAVHDLSIMDFIVGRAPERVSATGVSHIEGQPINQAYLSYGFDDSMFGHFHVNWLAPVKERRILVCGSDRMVVFDDLEMSEKVKVYDQGVMLSPAGQESAFDSHQRRVGYRTGDMWSPRLDNIEALEVEIEHFIDSMTGDSPCITDGQAGLRVVRELAAATESMTDHGRPVKIGRG